MPDVVGFADFVEGGQELCGRLSSRWREHVPDRLETFPYPKDGGKTRWMGVARCPDLVMLRTVGGRILRTTDPLLFDTVLACRLDPHGSAPWSFRDSRKAWERFQNAPAEIMQTTPTAGAVVGDVAGYFGSIDYHLMGERLHTWRSDLDAVTIVMMMLAEWGKAGNLQGLPIGPEAFGVLGNAFLQPLDAMVAEMGHVYFRYMDDFVIIGEDLPYEAIIARVDDTLAALKLRRNAVKTDIYENGRAGDALQDVLLRYVAPSGEAARRRLTAADLQALLEDEAEEPYPNPKHVRFALGGLRDGSGLPTLIQHRNLMNADPRATCAYIARHGLQTQDARQALIGCLDGTDDEFAGLRLHALLACASASWGGAEGAAFGTVASSPEQRAPVRAHAWHAVARTPAWKPRDVMEAADAEKHPLVKRAMVLTLRRAPDSSSRSAFLRTLTDDPFMRYAAQWVRQAA